MGHASLGTPIPNSAENASIPFHIGLVKCSMESVHQVLGEPHFQEWVDGLGDGDYWAFEYPCGMQLGFLFIHALGRGSGLEAPSGIVFGDLPEIQHGMRHVPFPSSCQTASTLEANAKEIEAYSKNDDPRAQQLGNLHAFQVWRQGDDGNEMPVGAPTTERDAKSWVQELESHGHKQMYWFGPT